MAAYGSISGDVRQADYWLVDHRIVYEDDGRDDEKKAIFKKCQDLSAAWLAVLCICERIRLVLGQRYVLKCTIDES